MICCIFVGVGGVNMVCCLLYGIVDDTCGFIYGLMCLRVWVCEKMSEFKNIISSLYSLWSEVIAVIRFNSPSQVYAYVSVHV